MKVGALFILVALVSPYPTVSVALWLVELECSCTGWAFDSEKGAFRMIDELSRGASRLLEIVARDFERQNCRFIDGAFTTRAGEARFTACTFARLTTANFSA